jgi:hypothetical protein
MPCSPSPKAQSPQIHKSIYLLALGVLLLHSCGFEEPRLLRVVSSQAPISLLVEEYNRLQQDYFVFFTLHPNPGEYIQEQGNSSDVVIGPHLFLPRLIQGFPSLALPLGQRSPEEEQLMNLGLAGGQRRLLPLSRNPLIIAFKPGGPFDQDSPTLEIDELRELGREYNRYRNGHLVRMGFDPLWNTRELTAILQAYGGDLSLVATAIQTEAQGFQQALAALTGWVEENGGYSASLRFRQKYFLGNPYSLLEEGRIGAHLTTQAEYEALPEEVKSQLKYRILVQDNRGFLTNGSLFVGLTGQGKESQAAADFVKWLLADRFSQDQRAIDKLKLTQGQPISYRRPSGKGRTPNAAPPVVDPAPFYLPQPSSPLWPRFYQSVFLPWLESFLQGQESLPLELSFQEWLSLNEVQE